MGVLGAVIGGGLLGIGSSYLSKRASDKAAGAAIQASETEAGAQREALDYLKEINELPQELREQALTRLGGLYGLEGGLGSQDELIQRAIDSPLYQQIMGGLDVGEEAILRNAGATGGLRSGNASYNLADYATRLQNEALLQSYNQQLMGLQGLAGLSTNENQIAQLISGIGGTLGQGQIAAAQSKQVGTQNMLNNLMGLGGLGVSAYNAGMFSDRRLKKNIKILGTIKGFNWCSFEWNSIAEKLGLHGKTYGIMADEVFETVPDAVILKDGFMFVLYDLLGFSKEGGIN
jgi:hypothetical protein